MRRGGKAVGLDDLHETLTRLLGEHDAIFEATWQRLTLAQRAALRAAVLEDGRELLSADVRARYRLGGPSTVQASLTALVRDDVLAREALALRRRRFAAPRVGARGTRTESQSAVHRLSMTLAVPHRPMARARDVPRVLPRRLRGRSARRPAPLLLLPNHPNSLLDPAVIWATSGRDVRFLAKSTLFDGPLRPLLAGAGAIPVYRKLDQGVDVSKNAETFAAVDAALAAGDAICIFPEGVSHSTGRLVPLRTGAARMALSAARAGTRVALVPVGLNFERKTAFRSRVTVVYGQPRSGATTSWRECRRAGRAAGGGPRADGSHRRRTCAGC